MTTSSSPNSTERTSLGHDQAGRGDGTGEGGERGGGKAGRPAWAMDIFNVTTTFADLGLRSSVLKGLEAAGFVHPTDIQARLIPLILEGKHVLGQARTGTGKTAAFGLPILHLCEKEMPIGSLILVPTRELAIQVEGELLKLGQFTPIRALAVIGGERINQQIAALQKGPQIIVGTPGRVMDMHQRGLLPYTNVRFAVLDEVDRMLDIGFRDDIRHILGGMPQRPQTIFVSATIMPEIESLARKFMVDPVKVQTSAGSLTVSQVDQSYLTVEPWDKKRLLLHLLTHEEPDLTLVFCRTKNTVDRLVKYLAEHGVESHAIHGDLPQRKRNSIMKKLHAGSLSVVVASDLAARGLDVEGISHVVNYDLPEDPEVYVHRIGRTARVGRHGIAWSFVSSDQGGLLTEIEKVANIHIPFKEYPDFKAGPVPSAVASEREAVAKKREAASNVRNRYAAPEAPAADGPVDRVKFPGGVTPTGAPRRVLGGKYRSRRGKK